MFSLISFEALFISLLIIGGPRGTGPPTQPSKSKIKINVSESELEILPFSSKSIYPQKILLKLIDTFRDKL